MWRAAACHFLGERSVKLSRILVCDLCHEEIEEHSGREERVVATKFVTESEGGFKIEITPPDNMDLCPACLRVGYARAGKTAWHENKRVRKGVNGERAN